MAERLIDANKLPVKQINIGGPMLPRWISVVYADDIDAAPTITPESLVRHTNWVMIPVNGAAKFRCGNIDCCRLIPRGCAPNDLAYCPHCGAKMDLEDHP